jgi:type I restriction enzyme S subunit
VNETNTDSWVDVSLSDAARPDSPIGYGIVQVGAHDPAGVPVLAIRDLERPSARTAHRSAHRVEAQYRRSRVTDGDILVSVKGTVGRVGLVPCGFDGNISRDVARIRLRDDQVPEYWLQLLRSADAQRILRDATVGTTRLELSIGVLKKLTFRVPSSANQRQIAEPLSDADDLISTLERLIAKKEAIKQGIMQELLTGKTRLPGFEGEWASATLGEIARIKTGSRNNQDKEQLGHYPFFVRSQHVERINSYSYDCEAILVPGEGGIGSIFHYVTGKFDVHQRVYAISGFSDRADGRFLFNFMRQFFGPHALENSVKATVDSLRLPTFVNFQVALPSVDEQRAIAKVLSDADNEITALHARLDKARATKQGMMQEILTGRARMPIPDETDPASVTAVEVEEVAA